MEGVRVGRGGCEGGAVEGVKVGQGEGDGSGVGQGEGLREE